MKLKQWSIVFFHSFVALYAATLFSVSLTTVFAQGEIQRAADTARTKVQVETLDRRMTSFEALHTDERLVRIETTLDALNKTQDKNAWSSDATMGGVALLLARAVYAQIKRKEL